MIAPHVVGILGGMGPAAGSDFSRLFVNACEAVLVARGEPVTDQACPEHWLAMVSRPLSSPARNFPWRCNPSLATRRCGW